MKFENLLNTTFETSDFKNASEKNVPTGLTKFVLSKNQKFEWKCDSDLSMRGYDRRIPMS